MYEGKRKIRRKRGKMTPLAIAVLVVLSLYSFLLIALIVWALMTSFKEQTDFRLNPIGFPSKFVWNYTEVFNLYKKEIQTSEGSAYVGMGMMFVYSLLYSVGCSFFGTLVSCITAYLCSRYKFFLSKVIYSIVIICMILPIIGSLPSEIQVAQTLGLYNHIWGLWIMKANFLGMYFLVFFELFKHIPKEYIEAAKIDGAWNFTILFRIMLPLARNTFFTVMLISFIGFWNDYSIPLIYLPSYPTIAVGMVEMGKTNINGMSTVPMRMTAAMLMLQPILIIYLVLHKKLIGNLTVGGIKG